MPSELDSRSIIVTVNLSDPDAALDVDLGNVAPRVAADVLYDAWCAVAAQPGHVHVRTFKGPLPDPTVDEDEDEETEEEE